MGTSHRVLYYVRQNFHPGKTINNTITMAIASIQVGFVVPLTRS